MKEPTDFEIFSAYMVLMTATEGKYWEPEHIEWAQKLMRTEKRVGVAILRDALAKKPQG